MDSESLKLNEISVIFGNALLLMVHTMAHPEIEAMSEHEQSLRSAMQPVYPSTETLTNRGISNRVINKLMQQLFQETQTLFTETLPDYLMQNYN
jgi:ATP-dependent DNA helicase RecG